MGFVRVLVALLALVTPALAVDAPEVLRKAVDGYIRPGFAQLAGRAEGLEKDLVHLCVAPSATQLTLARQQFGKVVEAFARVEFLKFGPLVEESRLERLLFWPDRKGIALKQVQAILGAEDESATRLASLKGKSVAVQGLTALEFVLFGTGAEALKRPEGGFRCRYGAAIGAAIADTAGEIAGAWAAPDGIAAHLVSPQAEFTDYRSTREALEELVGAIAYGIETIRDTRLLPFVGRDGATPKPKSALFWRSDLAVPAMRAGLAGIRDLLDASQIGLATEAENLWVDNSARFELGNALRAADAVTLPVEQALADPAQKKALDYLVILTGSLQTLLGENLSSALGLSVGFSSLDGD